MRKLTQQDITPEIKQAVSAYLMARVYAETMRAEVDKIETAVLEESEYLVKPEWCKRYGEKKIRVLKPSDSYLMEESDYKDFWAESVKRMKAAGLDRHLPKGETMEAGYCPALVAEELQRVAARLIVEVAEPLTGVSVDKITCHLDLYRKYVDLWVGLVVNLPDFENPLKGVKAA